MSTTQTITASHARRALHEIVAIFWSRGIPAEIEPGTDTVVSGDHRIDLAPVEGCDWVPVARHSTAPDGSVSTREIRVRTPLELGDAVRTLVLEVLP